MERGLQLTIQSIDDVTSNLLGLLSTCNDTVTNDCLEKSCVDLKRVVEKLKELADLDSQRNSSDIGMVVTEDTPDIPSHDETVVNEENYDVTSSETVANQENSAVTTSGADNAVASSTTVVWECPMCTFENSIRSRSCSVCGNKRPAYVHRPSSTRALNTFAAPTSGRRGSQLAVGNEVKDKKRRHESGKCTVGGIEKSNNEHKIDTTVGDQDEFKRRRNLGLMRKEDKSAAHPIKPQDMVVSPFPVVTTFAPEEYARRRELGFMRKEDINMCLSDAGQSSRHLQISMYDPSKKHKQHHATKQQLSIGNSSTKQQASLWVKQKAATGASGDDNPDPVPASTKLKISKSDEKMDKVKAISKSTDEKAKSTSSAGTPVGGTSVLIWTCTTCTLQNAMRSRVCIACGQQRSAGIKGTVTEPSYANAGPPAGDTVLDLPPDSPMTSNKTPRKKKFEAPASPGVAASRRAVCPSIFVDYLDLFAKECRKQNRERHLEPSEYTKACIRIGSAFQLDEKDLPTPSSSTKITAVHEGVLDGALYNEGVVSMESKTDDALHNSDRDSTGTVHNSEGLASIGTVLWHPNVMIPSKECDSLDVNSKNSSDPSCRWEGKYRHMQPEALRLLLERGRRCVGRDVSCDVLGAAGQDVLLCTASPVFESDELAAFEDAMALYWKDWCLIKDYVFQIFEDNIPLKRRVSISVGELQHYYYNVWRLDEGNKELCRKKLKKNGVKRKTNNLFVQPKVESPKVESTVAPCVLPVDQSTIDENDMIVTLDSENLDSQSSMDVMNLGCRGIVEIDSCADSAAELNFLTSGCGFNEYTRLSDDADPPVVDHEPLVEKSVHYSEESLEIVGESMCHTSAGKSADEMSAVSTTLSVDRAGSNHHSIASNGSIQCEYDCPDSSCDRDCYTRESGIHVYSNVTTGDVEEVAVGSPARSNSVTDSTAGVNSPGF